MHQGICAFDAIAMNIANYIYEGTQANFPTLVLENSNTGPVLVNFWAEWAGPCHRLFPLLARLAREYGGKFLLVNLNTDEQKAVAQAYGVKSLPIVKIFRRGRVVEEIHGYQPESELRRVLGRHVAQQSDERILAGVRSYQQGDVENGLSLLAQAALDDPGNLRIPVILGKLLMAQRRYDQAETLLERLPAERREQSEIAHLLSHIRFIRVAQEAPDSHVLRARLASNSHDLEARYQLAAQAVLGDEYETALESLLELARRDRGYGGDAGRKGMLAIFELLGDENPLVARYRTRMFEALH